MSRTIGSNYAAVKNLIHNEMGISKDDLKDLIRQIFSEEILRLLKSDKDAIDHTIKLHINKLVENALSDGYRNNFKDKVANQLTAEISKFVYTLLEVSVRLKED